MATPKKKKKKPSVWSAPTKGHYNIHKIRSDGKPYKSKIPGIRQSTKHGGHDEYRTVTQQKKSTLKSMRNEIHMDPNITPQIARHRKPDGSPIGARLAQPKGGARNAINTSAEYARAKAAARTAARKKAAAKKKKR
jgi:hypothetical protein